MNNAIEVLRSRAQQSDAFAVNSREDAQRLQAQADEALAAAEHHAKVADECRLAADRLEQESQP